MLILTILYIVFILTAIVLITVILLQEGKGGGLGDMLGSAGQQTFGVKAKGIQTFTAWAVVVFLASAVLVTKLNDSGSRSSVLGESLLDAPEGVSAPPATDSGGGAAEDAGN